MGTHILILLLFALVVLHNVSILALCVVALAAFRYFDRKE